MGRKGDAVTAREGSAQPSPVSPYLPSTGPFAACSGETPLGRKEGRFRPKEGALLAPLLGRGCGKRSFAEGRCVAFPYRSPFPHGHTGGKQPTRGGRRKPWQGERKGTRVPVRPPRLGEGADKSGERPALPAVPTDGRRGNAADRPEKGCALPCPPGDSYTAPLFVGCLARPSIPTVYIDTQGCRENTRYPPPACWLARIGGGM